MDKRTFLILFAVNMCDAAGLEICDQTLLEWLIFVECPDHTNKGLFELWASFLKGRNVDDTIETWNSSHED